MILSMSGLATLYHHPPILRRPSKDPRIWRKGRPGEPDSLSSVSLSFSSFWSPRRKMMSSGRSLPENLIFICILNNIQSFKLYSGVWLCLDRAHNMLVRLIDLVIDSHLHSVRGTINEFQDCTALNVKTVKTFLERMYSNAGNAPGR